MSPSPSSPRLRADAQRNRARIVQAASEAFREEGLEVSVAEIARRADVGSGTLFRNFPTKEDMIEAIVELEVGQMATITAELLELDDPAETFFEFFSKAVRFHYEDRGMLDAMACGILDRPQMAECRSRAMALTETVLERAKSAGVVREEISAADMHALASGIAQSVRIAVHDGSEDAESVQARFVGVILAGMRP